MPEPSEEVTYSSNDWQKVANELYAGSSGTKSDRYPPDMNPYAQHLSQKVYARAAVPPTEDRFTETLTSRDATYVRRAGQAVKATELPSTPQ